MDSLPQKNKVEQEVSRLAKGLSVLAGIGLVAFLAYPTLKEEVKNFRKIGLEDQFSVRKMDAEYQFNVRSNAFYSSITNFLSVANLNYDPNSRVEILMDKVRDYRLDNNGVVNDARLASPLGKVYSLESEYIKAQEKLESFRRK